MKKIYERFLASSGVNTDSRTVRKGEMFFALKGENFDGNRYAAQAVAGGAICAVVDDEAAVGDDKDRFILVDDVLAALQDLARWNRSQYNIPVLAITGTNGKTTTKELAAAVLSAKYRLVATAGNLNNHIGVPLTLLKIDASTEIAVVEMGASAPGEIEALAGIALPTFGLITNVGKAHLQGFGSFEGVKKTKGELYDYLQRSADLAFYNIDNPHLREMVSCHPDLRTKPYGLQFQGAGVMPVDADHPFLRISLADGRKIETSLVGAYNADNVMAALAVGEYFKVPLEDRISVISRYQPHNNRSQLQKTERNFLVIDAYNANPTSMMASLQNFSRSLFGSKMLILGDMRELGQESPAEHRAVMEYVAAMDVKQVCYVGEEFSALQPLVAEQIPHRASSVAFYRDAAALKEALRREPVSGKSILIKGSNGIRLQSVLEDL